MTTGQRIANTDLTFLGEAPRRSPLDRNRMGRFQCACGAVKVIRIASVRADHTVSCGCRGKRLFKSYWSERAGRLSQTLKDKIWSLRYVGQRRRGFRATRLDTKQIAAFLRLRSRYLVDFVVASICQALRTLAASGKSILDADLLHSQWIWMVRLTGALTSIASSRLMSFLLTLPDDAEITIEPA